MNVFATDNGAPCVDCRSTLHLYKPEPDNTADEYGRVLVRATCATCKARVTFYGSVGADVRGLSASHRNLPEERFEP